MSLRIYTRTGDDGTTGLFGGERVRKDILRIESYGDVDELNSALGFVRSLLAEHNPVADMLLGTIQDDLFVLGADLATPPGSRAQALRISQDRITFLENRIDTLESDLPPLRNFIHPGGCTAGAALHVARAVCRRAERHVVRLFHHEPDTGPLPMQYLNRLSDLLFVCARWVNHAVNIPEHLWQSGRDAGNR